MPRNPATQELPPPAAVLSGDADAVEVLRAWVVEGGLQVCLRPSFEDPALWGVLLVDVARHAARAYANEGTHTEAEALAQIIALWRAEIDAPTDLGRTRRGGLQ